jgi:hypothetical protein
LEFRLELLFELAIYPPPYGFWANPILTPILEQRKYLLLLPVVLSVEPF